MVTLTQKTVKNFQERVTLMDIAADYSGFLKVMAYYMTVGIVAHARWLGFFFFFPIIKWIQIPQTINVGICVAFSLPIWPLVTHNLAESNMLIYPIVSPDSGTMVDFAKISIMGIVFKEFLVGVLLSMFPSMLFMGFLLAGEVLDTARGDNKNSEGGNDALPMGNGGLFLFLTGSIIFIYSGQFGNMIQIIYDSYKTWPVHHTTEMLDIGKIGLFAGQAVEIFFETVTVFIPFVILIQSVDLVTFFQSKIDSKFHGEDMAPVVKNLLFMTGMMFYMYLVNAHGYSPIMDMVSALEKVVYE